MKYLRTSLVQIVEGSRLLLGMKKRGFGVGKWNGFGGKVNKDETLLAAAARELKEECNLNVAEKDLNPIGILLFEFEEGNKLMEVNVFKVINYSGVPVETEEMEPRFFSVNEIPFDSMWKDDKYWYPLMLQDKMFFGFFKFRNQQEMLSTELQEANNYVEVEKLFNEKLEKHDFRKFMEIS